MPDIGVQGMMMIMLMTLVTGRVHGMGLATGAGLRMTGRVHGMVSTLTAHAKRDTVANVETQSKLKCPQISGSKARSHRRIL